MDYLAHGLWSYIVFKKTGKPWHAVFFGLLADNLSWAIYLVFRIFTGSIEQGRPDITLIPDWMWTLYGISHSLIISLSVIGIAYYFKKDFIYMLAWPMAIVMDIFSHSRDFLPTPFLYPISDWHFPGISWGTKEFMIINYTLILFFMIYTHKNKFLKKDKFIKHPP